MHMPVRLSPLTIGSLILLLCAQGCASLPNAKEDSDAPHAEQVQFENTRGPVSNVRSDAILNRLEDSGPATDVLQKHLAYEQAVNSTSPLMLGNKLTLLQNGPATYKAMTAAIRAAKSSINLETYIFDGDAAKQFGDLLLERQAAGVQVNVIYDSVGSILMPQAFYDDLRAGGIHVLEFNPVNPLTGNKKDWLLNNRDHRRQLIIDGHTAFTGGINISDTYGSAPSKHGKHSKKQRDQAPIENVDPTVGWRDTHLQIEGPVVAEFQKLYFATWERQKGEPVAEANYFPELPVQGSEIVRAIGSTPADKESLIYLTLISAITHAETTIHLTVAYFAPDPQLLKALTDAAQRGVDVKLVLPSYSDSWPIFNLGRSYYTPLLEAGIHIYERRGAVMHAKTACIDGVWSTIGSTNLDWRSFLHNDEINAVVVGRGFAKQMEVMFTDDITESNAIELKQWKHRSWFSRIKERTARIGAYWL
jgi:cardiolipin synthase